MHKQRDGGSIGDSRGVPITPDVIILLIRIDELFCEIQFAFEICQAAFRHFLDDVLAVVIYLVILWIFFSYCVDKL